VNHRRHDAVRCAGVVRRDEQPRPQDDRRGALRDGPGARQAADRSRGHNLI